MNIIIFSKDRACQCDLTLTSLFNNFCYESEFPQVLYTFSDDRFERGYKKLIDKWANKVEFIKQNDFKNDLIMLCDNIQSYTTFFTDDNIFYRAIGLFDRYTIDHYFEDPSFCCFSLRLGDNILIQDYHRNIPITKPTIRSTGNTRLWYWRDASSQSNYGYPLSVDGHIFRTKDIQSLVDKFDYDNPNSFEGRIQQFLPQLPSMMASFDKSCVVNTPINRVQETCTNLAGTQYGLSAKDLNDWWLDGFTIPLSHINFNNIYGCHQEMPISVIKRIC